MQVYSKIDYVVDSGGIANNLYDHNHFTHIQPESCGYFDLTFCILLTINNLYGRAIKPRIKRNNRTITIPNTVVGHRGGGEGLTELIREYMNKFVLQTTKRHQFFL